MRKELESIRDEIMKAIGNVDLPFVAPVNNRNCFAQPSSFSARAQGVDNGRVSWQSLMCVRGSIQIYLKYMRSNVADDALRIRVADGDFAVKICIFDEGRAPQTSREKLFDKMKNLGIIKNAPPQNWARHTLSDITGKINVGAVFELYATGDRVGYIDEGASDRRLFVNSVAAAVQYLLPIAEKYIENRNTLLG